MPAGENAVPGKQGFQTTGKPAAELPELDSDTDDGPDVPELYSLPAEGIRAGMSTDDGQDFLTDAVRHGDTISASVYTPRSDDPDQDEANQAEPETRLYRVGEMVALAVFRDTQVDGRPAPAPDREYSWHEMSSEQAGSAARNLQRWSTEANDADQWEEVQFHQRSRTALTAQFAGIAADIDAEAPPVAPGGKPVDGLSTEQAESIRERLTAEIASADSEQQWEESAFYAGALNRLNAEYPPSEEG